MKGSHMKRLTSILASLTLAFSFAVPAFAQGSSSQYADLTVKATCSSSPPSVTVTNNSSFTTRIVSVNLEFKLTDLSKLKNLKSPQSIQQAFKPVVSSKMLAAGQSLTVTAKHPLGENEFFSASVTATSPSSIGTGQGQLTSINASCSNINASTLPKSGSFSGISGGTPGGMFPGMPQTGNGGMATYSRAAVAAYIAAR